MDIKSPALLYFKGVLFVLAGGIAAGILLLDHPGWREGCLLAMAVWCFCRAYYFAFYVIEHYVDSGYRYAGLWSFARYAMSRRGRRISPEEKP